MEVLEHISLEIAKLLNGLNLTQQKEVFIRAQGMLNIEPCSDRINDIFLHWNAQGIVKHFALTRDRQNAIKTALNDYPEQVLKEAIATYAEILHSADYYFKYTWSLEEFLKRGLEKFIDREVAIRNFSNHKGQPTRQSFNPQNYFRGRYGHVVRGNYPDTP